MLGLPQQVRRHELGVRGLVREQGEVAGAQTLAQARAASSAVPCRMSAPLVPAMVGLNV